MSTPLRFHPLDFRSVPIATAPPRRGTRCPQAAAPPAHPERPSHGFDPAQLSALVRSVLRRCGEPQRRDDPDPPKIEDDGAERPTEGPAPGTPGEDRTRSQGDTLRATIPPLPPPPDLVPPSESPLMIVEITGRIRLGQHLLRPDDDLNDVIAGVIGRAQHFTGVEIYGVHVLSNHLGLLVGVRNPSHAAAFTQRVFSQAADRVGRLRGIRARHWGRRNRAIVVDGQSDGTPLERMAYGLANGCKEGLVVHPQDWPGLHSARFFCKGERMKGRWTDHTAWSRARSQNPEAPERDFQTEYEVVHSKLPDLAHLPDDRYCDFVRDLCDELARQAEALRQATPSPAPPPPEALTTRPFDHVPEHFKPTRAPAVHTHSKARRQEFMLLLAAYSAALAAERDRQRQDAQARGRDFADEGIAPTGWRPLDPSTIRPPRGLAPPARRAAPS